MALKNVIFVALLVASVVMCKPKDSTAVHADNEIVQHAESPISNKAETTTQAANEVPVVHIPGRISCPHEEATEDPVCLEHCLPKGYSYGICVSKTCSCI